MRVTKIARTFALIAPMLALAACDEDPAAVGNGDPFAIVTNLSVVNAAVGDEIVLTAEVVDRGGTTLPVQVQVASTSGNFSVDSTKFVPELQFTRIWGKTNALGVKTYVVVSTGGLSDSVAVNVTSGPYPGAVALETVDGIEALVFTSEEPLFDGDASIEVATDEPVHVRFASPTRAEVLLPYGQNPADLDFTITDAGPNQYALTGSYALTQATASNDPYDPNDTPATSSNALVPGTALWGSVGTNDADDFYTLTVTEAGVYDIEVDWGDGADIDVFLLNSAGTLRACSDDFVGATGCAMATGNQPEHGTTRMLQPGTYRLYINLYQGDGPTTTYKLTVTRQ